jgi:hypothetical protein
MQSLKEKESKSIKTMSNESTLEVLYEKFLDCKSKENEKLALECSYKLDEIYKLQCDVGLIDFTNKSWKTLKPYIEDRISRIMKDTECAKCTLSFKLN